MATWNSDGSAANVQALHTSASDGDTITIPAGTFTWSTTVTITKGITLQGAGMDDTVLEDALTIGSSMLIFNLAAGQASRLSGIEITDGGRTVDPGTTGVLQVQGSNTNGSTFRWDHCRWNELRGIASFDTVIGVVDHVEFIYGTVNNVFFMWGSHWDGTDYGDGSWAAVTGFGTSQMGLFIEDCTIQYTLPGFASGFTDGYNGARFCVRHCEFTGNCFVQNHGTESSGRNRGTRAMEIYENSFDGTGITTVAGGSRSGCVLFHDNTIETGILSPAIFNLSNFRTDYPFLPWGGADGTCVWDVNDPTIYYTGTAASNSVGLTVTASGSPGWGTNQWMGYSVRRTTNLGSLSTLQFGLILSNTANTITYNDDGYTSTPLAFTSGDTVQIRRVIHCLDGIGRARGGLISEFVPVMPPGWNDQVTEPCYSWDNLRAGIPVNFAVSPAANIQTIDEGLHFFNDTEMPGYTEYVYPHPLVSGEEPPVEPPVGEAMLITGAPVY